MAGELTPLPASALEQLSSLENAVANVVGLVKRNEVPEGYIPVTESGELLALRQKALQQLADRTIAPYTDPAIVAFLFENLPARIKSFGDTYEKDRPGSGLNQDDRYIEVLSQQGEGSRVKQGGSNSVDLLLVNTAPGLRLRLLSFGFSSPIGKNTPDGYRHAISSAYPNVPQAEWTFNGLEYGHRGNISASKPLKSEDLLTNPPLFEGLLTGSHTLFHEADQAARARLLTPDQATNIRSFIQQISPPATP